MDADAMRLINWFMKSESHHHLLGFYLPQGHTLRHVTMLTELGGHSDPVKIVSEGTPQSYNLGLSKVNRTVAKSSNQWVNFQMGVRQITRARIQDQCHEDLCS